MASPLLHMNQIAFSNSGISLNGHSPPRKVTRVWNLFVQHHSISFPSRCRPLQNHQVLVPITNRAGQDVDHVEEF